MKNLLNWLENWFESQSDGDWEHHYGIKIETIDNPGWSVTIDLNYTNFENLDIDYKLYELSEDDWYGVSVKNKIFKGVGDINKLEFLILKFKEIIESS